MIPKVIQLIVIGAGVAFAIFIEILDWQGRAEVMEEKFPRLWRVLNARPARLVLLVVLVGFLAKDFHDASASIPPVKEQCWVKNYAAPALPGWGIAAIFCNTTIKTPYTVELDYDQPITAAGPFAFPVGSEFTKYSESNEGTKISAWLDLHTIVPNEPFSITTKGSSDKFPQVKKAIIKAKGLNIEFNP